MTGVLFAYGHLILQGKQLLRNQVLLPYYEATYKTAWRYLHITGR